MTQMKKIILFGDSIAAGLYQGEVVHALDHALSTTLKALGQADFKIINLGKKGDSTTSSLERLSQLPQDERTADYVVLNVGVNDAINQRDNQKNYRKNLDQLF